MQPQRPAMAIAKILLMVLNSSPFAGQSHQNNMHYNEDNTNLNITTETQRAQRKIFHFLGNVEFHFNFGFRDKQFHPLVRHSREVLP